jgi:hypothetical protein
MGWTDGLRAKFYTRPSHRALDASQQLEMTQSPDNLK